MNEINNIQKCLLLCEFWNFIDKLNNHNILHKNIQIIKINEYKHFKKNIHSISLHKNIPIELEKIIYSF